VPGVMPKTCTQCGRRGVNGTSRCELHPAPQLSEAERLQRQPYRRHYTSAEYRRNRLLAWQRAGGRCESCERPITMRTAQCDHRVPVADGGSDEPGNLNWLCKATCHPAKTLEDRRTRAARRRRA
jgi:5-methylcytosine-specific restriction protein A